MLFICYVLPFTYEKMLANQNATVLMKTTYILTCTLFAIIVHGLRLLTPREKNAQFLLIIAKAIRSKGFCLPTQKRNKHKLCNILYFLESKGVSFSQVWELSAWEGFYRGNS